MTQPPKTAAYRGNGEGSVYREVVRRPGGDTERWVAQVVVAGRKRRQVAKTEAMAKRKLRAMLHAVDSGLPLTPGNLTVGDLLEQWVQKHLPNRNLEPSTLARHQSSVRTLTRRLGTRKVRTLTPEQIETVLDQMAERGAARATLAKLRTTLGMALDWAERRGVVARNVARVVELPSNARRPRPGKTMTADQARRFLDAAVGTPLEAMWAAMLHLGLRPGEAAGLAWEDIDFENSVVHVRRGRKVDEHGSAFVGTTKTAWSVRSLDAPAPVMRALHAHRNEQRRQRLRAIEFWRDVDDLVFTSATGAPTDPAKVRNEFDAVVRRAKLGAGWSPNVLRHTAASLMADAGVPIEEVADQLGHRDTRMASLHYRHRIKPTVSGGTVLGDLLSR
jgi:integrase